MLVNHRDTGGEGSGWFIYRDLITVDANGSGVRLMKPIENGHERRLAGSIFSDYCVYLSALYIEVNVFVRVNGAKPLVNLFQFNR